jgi:tRNA threonylcarbamoyladenosine biosynthesis protein TsaB
MILHLDTTDQYKIIITLKKDKETIGQITEHNQFGSQILLPKIEQLLKDQHIHLKDLRAIEVATGPGSYTGIRVGVSVANALGFALKIPVNGKEFETELQYI